MGLGGGGGGRLLAAKQEGGLRTVQAFPRVPGTALQHRKSFCGVLRSSATLTRQLFVHDRLKRHCRSPAKVSHRKKR